MNSVPVKTRGAWSQEGGRVNGTVNLSAKVRAEKALDLNWKLTFIENKHGLERISVFHHRPFVEVLFRETRSRERGVRRRTPIKDVGY